MSQFNGIEIDMLTVGDADSILVTQWSPGARPMRVLVDGGNEDSADTVLSFLAGLGIGFIDHLVCTHPHDDHAAGLVHIASEMWLGIGAAWMHVPQRHLDLASLLTVQSRSRFESAAAGIQKSFETVDRLAAVLAARGVAVQEPFAGATIGPLLVLGPTADYYRQLLGDFTDVDKCAAFAKRVEQEKAVEQLLELIEPAGASDSLLTNPQTSAENNSSVVLFGSHGNSRFLLTADAGADALVRLMNFAHLQGLDWMQLPHHGSRRNLSRGLIEHFRPRIGYVSATGNPKHPRRAVVNAFKQVGTQVFSTHYPQPTHLWYALGTVPARAGYGPIIPLWHAPARALQLR